MRTSTQTDRLWRLYGDRRTIEMLASAGFDCIDYSFFPFMTGREALPNDKSPFCGEKSSALAYAKEMKKLAEDNGICFNQAHAPFPSGKENDEEYTRLVFPELVRSIELAGTLGADVICVHPLNRLIGQFEWNMELYRKLAPVAKDYGIKIGIENMFGANRLTGHYTPLVCSTPETLAYYYDALDDPEAFTVLLDIGHAPITGYKPAEFIRVLGHERLGALHVHDNNYEEDMHTLPFMVKHDWAETCAALKEISYKGDLTLEADNFMTKLPESCLQPALALMSAVARALADASSAGSN